MLHLSIVLCLISVVFAQSNDFNDYCVRIPSEYMDPKRIGGTWYEYERSSNNVDFKSKCQRLDWFSWINGRSMIVYTDTSTLINDRTKSVIEIEVSGNFLNGTLHQPVLGTVRKQYYILETDYSDYMIAVGCEGPESQKIFTVYVNRRLRNPSRNIDFIIQNAFRRRGLTPMPMTRADQSCNN